MHPFVFRLFVKVFLICAAFFWRWPALLHSACRRRAAEADAGAPWVQVPGGDGALAVVLLPRYLLINGLDLRLQYRQQGIAQARTHRRAPLQPPHHLRITPETHSTCLRAAANKASLRRASSYVTWCVALA
jgi:hypothetical protein